MGSVPQAPLPAGSAGQSSGDGKTYIAKGGPGLDLVPAEMDALLCEALEGALKDLDEKGPVLLIPPDTSRIHSRAGFLTGIAVRELARLGRPLGGIMPALGTHRPLGPAEINLMFPQHGSCPVPPGAFLVHHWRSDVVELGRLGGDWVRHISGGAVRWDWPVQVNRRLLRGNGGPALIISLGQVVPHEVAGMANHGKNILVGCGGKEAIDKSHYLGAVYGMERIMGRTNTPVRALFDEGLRRFGERLPPVLWVLTVVEAAGPEGNPVLRGLYAGFGRDCFERAAALARWVNVKLLDRPVKKIVAALSPGEFKTTWLGNKAVYRTRMALAEGGELIILAPGLEGFGEDPLLDRLIRRHGYRPAPQIQALVEEGTELAENLSVAAHLIHGASEGRFTVRYCPGGGLSRAAIEGAGYQWGSLDEALSRYKPATLTPGPNLLPGGEECFFIPNPALGLWAARERFED